MKKTGLQSIKGIGQALCDKLALFNIHTKYDLVRFFPTGYKDLGDVKLLCEVAEGSYSVIRATVYTVHQLRETRRGLNFFKVTAMSGEIVLSVTFFNQPYYRAKLVAGKEYVFFGKPTRNNQIFEMTNPLFEPSDDIKKLRGIVPIYRTQGKIMQGKMREMCMSAVQEFDFSWLGLSGDRLQKTREAYALIHNPTPNADILAAYQTIAQDELVGIMLAFRLCREASSRRAFCYTAENDRMTRLVATLPYTLTDSQQSAYEDILRELRSPFPMNRLLSGDVGSGKTVVAMLAMAYAAFSGHQAVLLAPTEILAAQHYRKIQPILAPFGLRTELLTAGGSKKQLKADIECGAVDIVIGTTAVVSKNVAYHSLSLVVTDESHRFGVATRARLLSKGTEVDSLILTATPIPRAVNLLYYGELADSFIERRHSIDELIDTTLTTDIEQVVRAIDDTCRRGHKAYVVCPRVTEDEEGMSMHSVDGLFETLCARLTTYRVGFVHGQQRAEDRNAVMQAFSEGDTQVLVASTVVEVGVDVPSATLMVIMDAERFGLATLHQLRGRVGRGSDKSQCLLYTKHADNDRLLQFCALTGGMELAELDMRTRGAGDYVGMRQSGNATSALAKYYSLDVMRAARAVADAVQPTPEEAESFLHSERYNANGVVASVVFN